jgi:hypothetical protein
MEREGDNVLLDDRALNPALPVKASELDTLLQEGEGEAAGETDAMAAAVRPLATSPFADVIVARRVVARWRAVITATASLLQYGAGCCQPFTRQIVPS